MENTRELHISLNNTTKTRQQMVRELTVEVVPALLISVAGSVLAGYILGHIQTSSAFKHIPALFIMVSVLLNLKSNIELNMSTRLSTQANLGELASKTAALIAVRANMELLLLQATIVGVGVGIISAVLSLLAGGSVGFCESAIVLVAVGTSSAVVGSTIIGVLIAATIAISHTFGIDPDNIGTPIASSFGDMMTLVVLSAVASVLVQEDHVGVAWWAWPAAVALGSVTLGVVLLRAVRDNGRMAHRVAEGWLPLAYAAATSSVAGVIVERCAARFPGLPALVPVVNGIGGNVGTVLASRISTSLHRHRPSLHEHNLTIVVLLLINVPVQVGFLVTHQLLNPTRSLSAAFLLVYAAATALHALAMLLLARFACKFIWSRGHDPDDWVNPFITGTGDMLGTILLALVFVEF
ncbi:hypothetical protein COEREDRAFT_77996 [Coemansia reversa NRRL 1564]|uniref:SLC41A/MgtE integral membrane domain-containing protein n=1 Tax=Coemansia reversa (strain ATCC 12441 / NRRL 1564) TaxID=763665 RepID=A0A2G5B2M1_COERN|nr:hypothetical protein COEREDRAFT_77996 [Coemansia reversa NRRL 1564]|eukprot:PIA13245.1 hypothetical protein COEREDRAFT_77996 [Coemansia reversa NRRL 1564]